MKSHLSYYCHSVWVCFDSNLSVQPALFTCLLLKPVMSEFYVVCVTLIRSETSVSSEIELIRRHAHGKTPDVQTL